MLDHPNIIVFTTDVMGCQQATDLGCTAIGIVHNSGFYPSPIQPPFPTAVQSSSSSPIPANTNTTTPTTSSPLLVPSLPATSLGESLLSNGASAVLEDYTNLKSNYLAHFMKKTSS
eukprot:TRINITY_DN5869_c0_g1_i1.p1 TRINITY_DN5869_c0_g1~~TRINITY_DN5869_c0_g1_i1.p1  ORF type:complete len:116 (-),score=20.94 TRINITY_DN5869_c0_g1_i1:316-663(-)